LSMCSNFNQPAFQFWFHVYDVKFHFPIIFLLEEIAESSCDCCSW
jgi:hypothetical protein